MSMFALGSLVGALLGGPLSDWTGRKATLVTGVVLSIIGTVLQTSSVFEMRTHLVSSQGCHD